MNFALNNTQETLREEIVGFAQSTLNEGVEERDRTECFDRSLWEQCGLRGLPGLIVPKELGGRGLSPISMCVALEALGYGCRDNGLSFALGAHLLACVVPIWKYGSTSQQREYLPNLCDGTWIATNAITETKSGSDVFSMSMKAVQNEQTYELNGEKNYCSNAPIADIAVVYAMTNAEKGALGGISGFILEKSKAQFDSPGKIEKMGLRSCQMGTVNVSNVRVSENAILGKPGGGTVHFTQSMLWERIGLSAIHIGTLHRLLEDAVAYAKGRKVFGKSIDRHQAIGHKLADVKVQLEAARMLVYKAAWLLEEGKNASNAASIAKLYVSEVYKTQTMNLLQVYGAIGYIKNSDIERSVRDSAAATLYSGTSEILKNMISRSMNK